MLTLMPSSRLTSILLSLCILLIVFFSFSIWSPASSYLDGSAAVSPPGQRPIPHPQRPGVRPLEIAPTIWLKQAEAIIRKAKTVADRPIESPYKYKFHTLGHRTQSARKWVQFLDEAPDSEDRHVVFQAVEDAIASMFPYLQNSPKNPDTTTPFDDLRNSFEPGSRGIVIPTGKKTMRYAAHLLSALQDVLETTLPVLVVYAGDKDFPPYERESLETRFPNVEFLDILTIVDDSLLKLEKGGWAIKAFAALFAPFEEVILADADCVFVQPPEKLYNDPSYTTHGALLFHDRLIWRHSYQDRHDWWRSQIQHPSAALNKSLVWTQDYAEEGDSGVVVLDKSRLDILMALLHVGWQNTKAVRDEVTYRMTHGDKESWWFGLELTGAGYAFEKHYGAMVGWERNDTATEKICSFVIGHVDEEDELFWYNGGLLKNKQVDPHEFGLPTHLMVDGKWHKGAHKEKESCMDESVGKALPREVVDILDRSITLAKELDVEFGFA